MHLQILTNTRLEPEVSTQHVLPSLFLLYLVLSQPVLSNNAARCHIVISRLFLTSLSCPGQLRSIVKSRSTMPRLTPALPLPYRYPTLPCSALCLGPSCTVSVSPAGGTSRPCVPALARLVLPWTAQPRHCPARPCFAISPWFSGLGPILGLCCAALCY